MEMGEERRERQETIWVETSALPSAPGHPFYERLNEVLKRHGFMDFAEEECRQYYAERLGRPSIPPTVYFKMLFIGFF